MNDILKIISDNAANRATISAAPIASGMSAAAMQNDTCANVCRAPGTSMTITLVWPVLERIGGVHLPWSNLSPGATMRVRGYSDAAGTAQVFDTGAILACPWPVIKLLGSWTAATAASAYAYGGGAHARSWFANEMVKRIDVDLVDVGNLQGYLEVARIFAGDAWSPSQNADYNPGLTPGGTGEAFRDGAGGRRTRRGTKSRKMSVALSHMNEADRAAMWGVLAANGIEIPFIFSLYPNDTYPARERDHQMYCGLVATAAMRRPNFAEHATALELETV